MDKLGNLKLISLEYQRLRGNLIEVYKIMKGIEKAVTQNRFPRLKC